MGRSARAWLFSPISRHSRQLWHPVYECGPVAIEGPLGRITNSPHLTKKYFRYRGAASVTLAAVSGGPSSGIGPPPAAAELIR